MIAQGWPCWLSTILAFCLLLGAAYVAPSLHPFFLPLMEESRVVPWKDLADLHSLIHWPVAWDNSPVLVSGSQDFLNLVISKLNGHVGPFIHAMEFFFTGHWMRLTERLHKK
jgi:hypothetical protein